MVARLDSIETEGGRNALRLDAAETVLLEKGVADEEDLEEARRYFEQAASPATTGRGTAASTTAGSNLGFSGWRR
jgi:hypothetical protein